jgi:hypothetical protein
MLLLIPFGICFLELLSFVNLFFLLNLFLLSLLASLFSLSLLLLILLIHASLLEHLPNPPILLLLVHLFLKLRLILHGRQLFFVLRVKLFHALEQAGSALGVFVVQACFVGVQAEVLL